MSRRVSRRTFLSRTAALAAATAVAPTLAAQKAAPSPHTAHSEAWPENGTLIPDEGWHLWVDEHAPWMADDIFLPEDIAWQDGKLCAKGHPLPVNAPTGGWEALTATTGKQVMLPTSVEQHFWGKYGAGGNGTARPYTPEEYRYAAPNPPSQNSVILSGALAPSASAQSKDLHNRPPSTSAQTLSATEPATPVNAPPADDYIPQNGAYFGVSWFHRAISIPAEMRGKRIFLHIRGAHLRAEVYLNGQLCGYSIMEELPLEADLTHAANPGGTNHLAIRITNPFGRYDWVDGLNAKWGKVSLYRSHGFGALDRGITMSAHTIFGGIRATDAWVLNTPNPKTVKAYLSVEFLDPMMDAKKTRLIDCEVIDPVTNKVVASRQMPIEIGWDKRKNAGSVEITYPEAKLWNRDAPKLYHLRFSTSAGIFNGGPNMRTIAFGFRSFTVTGIDPANPSSNAVFRLNGKRTKIYTAISWGYWGLNGMFPVPELAEKEVRSAQALGLNCLNFHRNLAKEDVLRAHDRHGVLRYMEPGAGKLAIGQQPNNIAANTNSVIMETPKDAATKFAQRYMFTKCVEMVKAFRSHPSVIEYCLQNELGADFKNPATLAILKAMHDEDPSRCVVLNDGFVAPPRSAAQAWYEPWSDKLHRSDETPFGDWWNNHQGAGDQWYDEFYKSPTDYTYNINLRNILTEYGEMEGCARPDVHGLDVHQITTAPLAKYGGVAYDLQDHKEVIAGYNKFLDKWGFRKSFPTPDHVFLAVGRTCYESWQNYMENARINDALDFAAISGWESTAIENHSGIVNNLRNFKSDPKLIGDTLLPIRPCAKQRALAVAQGKAALFDLYLFNDTSTPATGTLTFTMITPKGERKELTALPAPAHVTDQFSYLLKEAFTTPPLTEEGLYRFKFSISSEPLATHTKEIWVTEQYSAKYKAEQVQPTHPEPHTLYDITLLTKRTVAVSGIAPSLRKQLAALNLSLQDFKPGEKYDLIISGGMTSHTTGDQNVGETTGESMPVMKPGHTPEPGEEATPTQLGHLQKGILEAVKAGTPLLAIPQADTLSDGVAQQLAEAGAFTYNGSVGDFRAPWMGNWYFVREHALFAGLPQNCGLGGFYQCKGRPSNGLLIDRAPSGPEVEVVVGYSRDHDRNVGAGTFTSRVGKGKLLFHRCPDFHPVLQQRFLANAIRWLTT